MAKYWTYAEIRTKIQADTDTEAEDFIQTSELLDIVNEAIDTCEAAIHKLGLEDDYFLKWQHIPLATGEDMVNLPDDIYAFKIRGLIYEFNERRYAMKRVRGRRVFSKVSNIQQYNTADNFYQYLITNDSNQAAAQILLLPQSQETSSDHVKMWYIRNANRMVDDTSICDIPEFVHYVIARSKFKIYFKEGHPLTGPAKDEMELQERRMIDTLANMVPDHDSLIEPDLDHYRDMADVDMFNP